MENRVYYGEYSLKHWIDLILKQNITLPDYQRYFVWNENKVKTLIETFKKKQFVPPVTIGAFKFEGEDFNLILDGQQRLTSIILSYLGIYPDDANYKTFIETFVNDNDEYDTESQIDNILSWDFKQLTEKGNNKARILQNLTEGNYKTVDFGIDEELLKNTYLGFSYLVPQIDNEKEQQKYYSSVFRNINIQGDPLLPQESRASLYFLDKDMVELFSPNFSNNIKVKILQSSSKIDFVRYLSLLSQYHKNGDSSRVARSYKPKMEKYYEEYIYSAINNEDSFMFGKFDTIFENREYKPILATIEEHLNSLSIKKEYNSIIDTDIFLFGLFYHIIFKKEKIDSNKKEEITQEIEEIISIYKNDYSHKRSPNNLGHLRERISRSIQIYQKYSVNES